MHHDPGVPIARRSIEIETADSLTLRGDCVTGPGRPKGIVIVVVFFALIRFTLIIWAQAPSSSIPRRARPMAVEKSCR